MLFLFHIAIPLILFEIPYLKERIEVNRLTILISSILPDFIDKMVFIFGIGYGRFISHSLLFLFSSFILIFLFNKFLLSTSLAEKIENSYSVPISFFIGNFFHLILDLPLHGILFYPFIKYEPHYIFPYFGAAINSWIIEFFSNPLLISTEIAGLIMLIFIIIHNKLYKFKKLWNYFSNTH
jgi:hypothetical protein